MSSRKLQHRAFSHSTPTSSNQRNLNSTMLVDTRGSARGKISSLLNSTTTSPHVSVNLVPTLNVVETECDLAYNKYLQKLVKQNILQNAILSKKAKCNDALENIREEVSTLRDKEDTLIEEIENIDISRGLTKGLDELKAAINENEQILNKNILAQVNYFVKILTGVINKLYLHNVQPLRNKEEYGKFDSLINTISAVLEKTLNLAGDFEGVDKLASCLSENCNKHGEIINRSKAVNRLQDSIAISTLEKTSNLLAGYKENIEFIN